MQRISGTHWLDNKYVSGSGSRTAVIDPATALQCGEFANATNNEIDLAVRNANRAQREWWSMSALDRANALHSVAERMLAMTATTGEVLTREMGKPFRESNWESGASASAFRYYAEIARNDQGRIAGPAIAGQLLSLIHI